MERNTLFDLLIRPLYISKREWIHSVVESIEHQAVVDDELVFNSQQFFESKDAQFSQLLQSIRRGSGNRLIGQLSMASGGIKLPPNKKNKIFHANAPKIRIHTEDIIKRITEESPMFNEEDDYGGGVLLPVPPTEQSRIDAGVGDQSKRLDTGHSLEVRKKKGSMMHKLRSPKKKISIRGLNALDSSPPDTKRGDFVIANLDPTPDKAPNRPGTPKKDNDKHKKVSESEDDSSSISKSSSSDDHSGNSTPKSHKDEMPKMTAGRALLKAVDVSHIDTQHKDLVVRAIDRRQSMPRPIIKKKTNKVAAPPKESDTLSVTGLRHLKTVLMRGSETNNSGDKSAVSKKNELFENRMTDDFLEENFVEDAREYEYKSWNHTICYSKANFKYSAERKRPTQVVSQIFTEEEQKWKEFFEKTKPSNVTRSVCLEYEYSPDLCFNSMIDVYNNKITSLSVEEVINQVGEYVEEVTRKHHYSARILKPHDSLHVKGEFPPNLKRRYGPIVDNIQEVIYEENLGSDASDESVGEIRQTERWRQKRDTRKNHLREMDTMSKKKYFMLGESNKLTRTSTNLLYQAEQNHDEFDDEDKVKRLDPGLFPPKFFRGRHKTRRKLVIERINSETIFERFLSDFVDVDRKALKTDPAITGEDLYDGLRKRMNGEEEFDDLNWSAEQVLSKRHFPIYRIHSVLKDMNHFDLEIWLTGCRGFNRMLRKWVKEFMNANATKSFLIFCTLLNLVVLTLPDLMPANISNIMAYINYSLSFVYILELILNLYSLGVKKYLRSISNVLDGIVAIIVLFEIVIVKIDGRLTEPTLLSAVRTIRTIRILRQIKFMGLISEVIKATVEQYAYVSMILLLFMFIFSLLGMQLFGGIEETSDTQMRTNFDSIRGSFEALFQLLTLENWVDILEYLYTTSVPRYITVVYVLAWIFIGTYTIFNLFLALLLGGFDDVDLITTMQERRDEYKVIEEQIRKDAELLSKQQLVFGLKLGQQEQDIMYIIDENKMKSNIAEHDSRLNLLDKESQKERAMYFPMRNTIEDESSLDELFDRTLDKILQPRINTYTLNNKRMLYKGVKEDRSLNLFSKDSFIRRVSAFVVTHPLFEKFIMVIIALSMIKLVAETYINDLDPDTVPKALAIFEYIEWTYAIIFWLECGMKVIRAGLINEKGSYLRDPWSWLEVAVVAASTADILISDQRANILKILRALRTFRLILSSKSMRVILRSLWSTLVPLANVSLVILLVWVVFAIVGNSLLRGKLGRCSSDDYYNVSKAQCLQDGYFWTRQPWNHDNILESLLTLFVLSTLEAWPELVTASVDAGGENTGPVYLNNVWILVYYYLFIFISAMFLMDLFVGVIFYQFGLQSEEGNLLSTGMCTEEQVKWITIQKMIARSKPKFIFLKEPTSAIRAFFFRIVTTRKFGKVMVWIVLLDIVNMGLESFEMSDTQELIHRVIRIFCSCAFGIEVATKICALRKDFFRQKSHYVDLIVALIGVAEHILFRLGSDSTNFWSTAMSIQRHLKVLRLIRVYRLVRTKPLLLLMRIIDTLIFNMPMISNVLILLLINYLLFSVIACTIFESALHFVDDDTENSVFGFRNFHLSLMYLVRLSTGENWPVVMYSYGDAPGMYIGSRLFFIVFVFITSIIFINMFELVIVQIFDNFYFNKDNPLLIFERAKEEFDRTWAIFSVPTKGFRIQYLNLVRFFAHLQEPLGFRVKDGVSSVPIEKVIQQEEHFIIRRPIAAIAIILALNNVPLDDEGYASYGAVLQLAMRFMYGNKALIQSTYTAFKLIKQAEADALASTVVKESERQKTLESLNSNKLAGNKYQFNIVMDIMNMKIGLRVWREYCLLYDQFAAREGIITDQEIFKFIINQREKEIKFYNNDAEEIKNLTSMKQGKSQLANFLKVYLALLSSRIV